MQLDHQFSVPAPVDIVWEALLDPERVAPCMPGAALDTVDGSTFTGTVKVKLGPVSLTYKGKGEFVETDAAARTVVIKANGKDSRGAGTAAATVTVTLTGDGASTNGAVTTELNITGKPAQFGRGMIADVGAKILDDFAGRLAKQLGDSAPAAAPPTPSTSDSAASPAAAAKPAPTSAPAPKPAPKPAPEPNAPIDLMSYAGNPVATRVVPIVAAALAALTLVFVILRRRGNR